MFSSLSHFFWLCVDLQMGLVVAVVIITSAVTNSHFDFWYVTMLEMVVKKI